MVRLLKQYGTVLILVSVLLATGLGIWTPALFNKIQFLGEIFLNLLKLFTLPLVTSTLIVTLGNMSRSLGSLKALMRGVMSYMFLSEIVAVSIALCLFNLFKVGQGVAPQLILHGAEPLAVTTATFQISSFLLAIFPQNIFESLAKFDLLPVVIFSAMFGVGCALCGKHARPIITLSIAIREVASKCLQGVMLFSPLGIFVLMGAGIANSHLAGGLDASFTALLAFVSVLLIGLLLHVLWQLALAMFYSKQPVTAILKQSIPVFSTAFATSSSVATLPVAIFAAERLQADTNVTRFMLPLCASINVGGMMMYEVAAALFFSQVLGYDLSLFQQILVALASILGGMAEGGIPETSLVSLVVVFRIVHIPLSAISLLLPLDRIIDRFRTMANIFGNMCGVIVVSQVLRRSSSKDRNVNPL